MLHPGFTDRALAELEAESVACVVCSSALDLDSGDYSFGYLATWAGGGAEVSAGINASGSRVQRAADEILLKLEGEQTIGRSWGTSRRPPCGLTPIYSGSSTDLATAQRARAGVPPSTL